MSTLDTSGEVKSDAHSELELRRIRFCWILGSLERSSNCARIISILPHLLAHLSNILAKEKEIWRKREVTNGKKSYSLCHARLCGGGDLLKALGIVAGYLADAIFYLTNDTGTGATATQALQKKPKKHDRIFHGEQVRLALEAELLTENYPPQPMSAVATHCSVHTSRISAAQFRPIIRHIGRNSEMRGSRGFLMRYGR
jgi:hypothetical protein